MTSPVDLSKEALDAINGFRRAEAQPSRRQDFGLRLNNDPTPIIGVVSTVDSYNEATVHRFKMVHELKDFREFSVRWQNDNVAVMCNITQVEMLGERLIGVARNLVVQVGRDIVLAHETEIDVTFEPGYIVIPQEIHGLCRRVLARP